MAYVKNPTWQDDETGGTPILAENLNHIEDGIYSAASTADTALSNAATAQSTATSAQSTATEANTKATQAKSTADSTASTVATYDSRITALEGALADFMEGAS